MPGKMKRTIVARRETVKLNPRGEMVRWVVFEVMLDNLGPFVFEFPKSEFVWQLLKEAIDAEERGLAEYTIG